MRLRSNLWVNEPRLAALARPLTAMLALEKQSQWHLILDAA